ncbi:MAG: phosphoribosyl-AMP cyclohydrolase [Hyphomicrobiaceae bacterium]|nr:phosphoribosyl-AMP cyclohydrolase [Hyphomicrobiaceae bacterium]
MQTSPDIELQFDARGLIPAIAQQHDTGEVLMLAWMSRESLAETLRSGRVCYWSRSRGALWRKGETSGHVQRLVECRLDCDGDALLLRVDQTGPACHTGARSCFFNCVPADAAERSASLAGAASRSRPEAESSASLNSDQGPRWTSIA